MDRGLQRAHDGLQDLPPARRTLRPLTDMASYTTGSQTGARKKALQNAGRTHKIEGRGAELDK